MDDRGSRLAQHDAGKLRTIQARYWICCQSARGEKSDGGLLQARKSPEGMKSELLAVKQRPVAPISWWQKGDSQLWTTLASECLRLWSCHIFVSFCVILERLWIPNVVVFLTSNVAFGKPQSDRHAKADFQNVDPS